MRHEPVEELMKLLVSEHMYHDIFVTEFNIHFGYLCSDSCSTCDGLKVQIEAATEVEKPPLQTTLQQHHQLAEEGYQAFHYDREQARNHGLRIGVITQAVVVNVCMNRDKKNMKSTCIYILLYTKHY